MTMTTSAEKLRQKLNLKKYLSELSTLTGRAVQSDELGSLAQVNSIREAGQKFREQPGKSCEIPFSDRTSERFKGFVEALHNANPSPIYLWTPRTIWCGALLLPSLEAVRFGFNFAVNEEGILVFLTSDLEDRLLLDFSGSPSAEQTMKLEVQGANWAKVAY